MGLKAIQKYSNEQWNIVQQKQHLNTVGLNFKNKTFSAKINDNVVLNEASSFTLIVVRVMF